MEHQIAFSLKRFSPAVRSGKLTLFAAVYDFRNDRRHGAGKLVLVNVNGDADPERRESFVEQVNAGRKPHDPRQPAKDIEEQATAHEHRAPRLRAAPRFAAALRGLESCPSLAG